MRPGRLTANGFELAVLRCILSNEPSIAEGLDRLHVLSRELTGVGSFTRFQREGGGAERHFGLDALIKMPGVPNGMGAVLFCKGGEPECLEVYTFGDDHWDGTHEGFSIEPTA